MARLPGVTRYGILLAAALRGDRSAALMIAARVADSFQRRGVEHPGAIGWVRWSERIGKAAGGSAPAQAARLQSRSRRLLRVMQRLAYGDQAFRKMDLRYIRGFYLNYCVGIAIIRD